MSAIAPIGQNLGLPSVEGMQSPELRIQNKQLEPHETQGPGSFGHILTEARGLENQASTAQDRFAAGDPGMGIHEVMIATEKANIAVRYAATLKNKVLEAYRELMQTQV